MTEKAFTFPEHFKQYAWGADYENVVANSKNDSRKSSGMANTLPKAPVSLVLEVLLECLETPEVMQAYDDLSLDDDDPIRHQARELTIWHTEYLKHKYGTETAPYTHVPSAIIGFVKGRFSSIDDPKLREFLLEQYFIKDDERDV